MFKKLAVVFVAAFCVLLAVPTMSPKLAPYFPSWIGPVGIHMLDHGNAEGKGLTGAGRCLGDHILPLHKAGNGLLLDSSGPAVALLFQRLQHGLRQAKVGKRQILVHILSSFFILYLNLYILPVFPAFCNRSTKKSSPPTAVRIFNHSANTSQRTFRLAAKSILYWNQFFKPSRTTTLPC